MQSSWLEWETTMDVSEASKMCNDDIEQQQQLCSSFNPGNLGWVGTVPFHICCPSPRLPPATYLCNFSPWTILDLGHSDFELSVFHSRRQLGSQTWFFLYFFVRASQGAYLLRSRRIVIRDCTQLCMEFFCNASRYLQSTTH